MITVLVVEDSPTVREFLVHILTNAGIRVIGAVSDGEEAVRFVQQTRPDVVTMDIHMPVMNGIEATARIMETNPVPIVIVSSNWDPREVEMTFRAMEAGALAIVRRPQGIGHPDHEATAAELVLKVRLMSEVKVVRRWSRQQPKNPDVANDSPQRPRERPGKRQGGGNRRVNGRSGGPSDDPSRDNAGLSCADPHRSTYGSRLSSRHGGVAPRHLPDSPQNRRAW